MSLFQKDLPYFTEGPVVTGFGRGGKELGVPTANFPEDVVHHLPASFECGVYYGWAKLSCDDSVRKMVMSVGWNPYYHNTVKTMETHIMHKYDFDFYGKHLKVAVLGYIRPMSDFESLEALIAAIQNDIAEANERLEDPACLKYAHDPFFISTLVPSTSDTEHARNNSCNGVCNGILPSLHSANLKKHAINSDTKSSESCENNHFFKGKLFEDKFCENQYQKSCNGDVNILSSYTIETYGTPKIIPNGHSEAQDTSIFRPTSEDIYTSQTVF